MSNVILTIVYGLFVIPVGLFRKWMGKDPVQLKGFGNGKASVMYTRTHTFSSQDIDQPF